MEDRMTFLESELAELKQAKATSSDTEIDITATDKSSEHGDDDDYFVLPKLPYRMIDEQEWNDFHGRVGEPSVVEILKGEVGVGRSKWFTAGPFYQSVKSVVSGNNTEPGTNALAVETRISLPHRVKYAFVLFSRGSLHSQRAGSTLTPSLQCWKRSLRLHGPPLHSVLSSRLSKHLFYLKQRFVMN